MGVKSGVRYEQLSVHSVFFFLVSLFLTCRIIDGHDICGVNIPRSVLQMFLQVVIGVVEEFEKSDASLAVRPVVAGLFLSGWHVRAICL